MFGFFATDVAFATWLSVGFPKIAQHRSDAARIIREGKLANGVEPKFHNATSVFVDSAGED